jgi:hypothetical protein
MQHRIFQKIFKEISSEDGHINLSYGRAQWLVRINMVMNLLVPEKKENFLTI